MPIISQSFSRIAIDIVEPLTSSSRGHRYVLTPSRAVPLKNIDAVTAAESVVEIFSRVGFQKRFLMTE